VAAYLRDVQPTRILALGEWAVYSVFGYKVSPMSARRGFGWLPNGAPIRCPCGAPYAWKDGGPVCSRSARHDRPRQRPIPVIFLFHPAAAVRNRYLRPEFEGDLRWALSTPDEEFSRQYFHVMGGRAHIVDTEEDARLAVQALRVPAGDEQGTISTDIESRGKLHNEDFKIISIAACRSGEADAYVWDRDAIEKGFATPFADLTQDPSQTFVTHSHFDDRGLHCYFGAPIAGTRRDTRLLHKLAYPDVDADLGTVSDFVGVGFYKDDMKVHLDQAIAAARKQGAKQTSFFFVASLDDHAQRAIVEGFKQHGSKFEPRSYAYALVPRLPLSLYNAIDTVVTGIYHQKIWPKIRADEGLALVWDQIRQPASRSFHWMAYWGLPIDRSAVQTMIWAAQNEQTELGLRLRRYLRGEYQNISLASTEQVGDFLFGPRSRGAYGLPPQKLTEKEKRPSTDTEALEQLDAFLRKALEANDDPVYREALEFLELYTLYTEKDGFIEKGAEYLRFTCQDGRVHPSYLLDGTRTGRPSCIAAGSMVEVVRDVSAHPKGVAIEQVKEGDLVYCYDKNRELCLRRVLWAGKTGRRRVVRLHWQGSGHRRKGYLDLTPEHPVRMVDGHYRQAQHLKPMDRVMALSRGIKAGYGRLWPTGDCGEVRDHCFVFRQVYGDLPEHVHHLNDNKLDNRPENLEGLSAAEHTRHHGLTMPDVRREKISRAMTARHRDNPESFQRALGALREAREAKRLNLSREQVIEILERNGWALTRVRDNEGIDFDTFKGYVEAAGLDVEEIKERARVLDKLNGRGLGKYVRGPRVYTCKNCGGVGHYSTTCKAPRSNNHEVLEVVDLGMEVDVYDITVEGEHNFIVEELCVHNSSGPNVFNMRRPDECEDCRGKGCASCLNTGVDQEAQRVRNCFAAPDGFVFLEADESQVELRGMAALGKDPVLTRAFVEGRDVHEYAAGEASRGSGMHVTRQQAKPVNFGVGYGLTARSLAKRLKCSVEQAEKIMRAVMGAYTGVSRHKQEMIEFVMNHGYTYTVWFVEGPGGKWTTRMAGRRPLVDVGSEDGARRSQATNGAYNCVDADTEALTARGWVRGFDLQPGDVLLTKNPVSGALEWQPATDVKKFPDYAGPLVEFKSRSFHAVSTPDHRWLVFNKGTGRDECRTTERISPYGDHRIHRTGTNCAIGSGLSDDLVELSAWFLTDGGLRRPRVLTAERRRADRRHGPVAMLYQSLRANPDLVQRIDTLVARLGALHKRTMNPSSQVVTWTLTKDVSAQLADLFPERVATMDFLRALSAVQARLLFDVMILADGSITEAKNDAQRDAYVFCCRDENRASMFQVIALLAGFATTVAQRDMSGYSPRSHKMPNVPKMGVCWLVKVLRRDKAQVTAAQRREISESRGIWCPVVGNTYFVARRSGSVFITGNTLIQGTFSGFLVLAAHAAMVEWILAEGLQNDVQLVLTVYDSLCFLVRECYVEMLARKVTYEMTRFVIGYLDDGVTPFPLKSDVKVGRTLGTLKKYKVPV
jgi:DNA polymerase I-like protein with 3'-5' exonuclease and polymerase domains